MRKKFTLLIMTATLFCMGSGGKLWGQDIPGPSANGPSSNNYLCGTYTINGTSWIEPDNNFGPGETGILRPMPPWSIYGGLWVSNTNTGQTEYPNDPLGTDRFSTGNGIITVGGTQNVVMIRANRASVTDYCEFDYRPSTSSTLQNYYSRATLYAPTARPSIPDGTGIRWIDDVPSTQTNYTTATTITVDAQRTSNAPWELQQFYFMDNPWYYHSYALSLSPTDICASGNYTHYYQYYDSGLGYNVWTSTTLSCAHAGVGYQQSGPTRGGYVDAVITLTAGSHVHLNGTQGSNGSINSATTGTSASRSDSRLNLPSTHYTLMNDATFYADNNTLTVNNLGDGGNGNPLGEDAVMGINQQFRVGTTNTNMKTNPAGGTILIGATTDQTSQDKMTVQSVPTNVGSNGKTFARSTYTGSTASYLGHHLPIHGSANLGNYGNNAVTLLNQSLFGTSSPAVGAGLMQIYNHSCNPLNFSGPTTSPTSGWAFTLSTGHLLIEGSQNVNFNRPQTFTGGTSANLTINGGAVNFNTNHTYESTLATTGDYGVYGYKYNYAPSTFVSCYFSPDPGTPTYNYGSAAPNNVVGTTGYFCGTGDINVIANAVVRVINGVNVSGETRWQAANNINTEENVTFTHSGSGATVWQAGQDILTGNNTKTVTFTQNGTGTTNWNADRDIETSSIIRFENNGSPNTGTGNTSWTARRDITTNQPVTFLRSSASGTTAWTAYNNITTHQTITFTNSGPNNITSWLAWSNISTNHDVMFTNTGNAGSTTWTAHNNITTSGGTTGVTFTHDGNSTGTTDWNAINGSITTNNPVLFTHTAAALGNDIKWTAGKNIVTNNTVRYNYATNSTIEWWAQNGMIQTNDQIDIVRSNTGAGETYLHAGDGTYHLNEDYDDCDGTDEVTNNIEIESVFNYTETATTNTGAGKVTFYAENDILTNTSCEDNTGSHPMLGPAPVTFTVGTGSQTITLWEAQRNINTKGVVNFTYAGATAMGPLTWLSRGGYIQTERPVNITYTSNERISFRAEDMRVDQPNIAAQANANVSGRRGNIHLFDQMNITRNNTGAVGLTEFKAENHIWTAMFDYKDLNSTGNSTDIISHMGDIYLGHNDGRTSNAEYNYYLSSLASVSPGFRLTQQSPSNLAGCNYPAGTPVSYDLNVFNYQVNAANITGHLNIKAGYEDDDLSNIPAGGGNIYFTHKNIDLAIGTNHDTEVSIPFSNWYICGHSTYGDRQYYEKSGIIGGVARCAIIYEHPLSANTLCDLTGLEYNGFNGNLVFNTKRRGNIIINNGVNLNFHNGTGYAQYLTQEGDIDMRYEFNAEQMQGSLLFYANSLLPDKLKFDPCGCLEKTNNVYLQDFEYTPVPQGSGSSGSVFIGADNNIKLQYGGLQTVGGEFDPFFNESNYPCGTIYRHCDSDTTVNQARHLYLDFRNTSSGGFAAVASDLIDVYKKMYFHGGTGSGMGTVPGYGSLHGENVTGYGLYIKSQGNKENWTRNAFDILGQCVKGCPHTCNDAFLHNVARVTFHDDARILAENSRAYIGSPVLEVYGALDLNTSKDPGTRTSIRIQTDSLIVHDSLIIDGPKTQFTTWSKLERDMPVFKLGHHRFTPPFNEPGCEQCVFHDYSYTGLDTIAVTFRNDGRLDRLHTLVADHTVLTFLTDSFDHKAGNPVLEAKIFTDIFKIRNQVELWSDTQVEHSGHFELISEPQMLSKDYSGIFARQLHMEPIAPICKGSNKYSDLWIVEPALDVISSTRFGGFGTLHADVHVETQAVIAPGYASLGVFGNCYEQMSGTLKMKDLRLDRGAQLHFSIGDETGMDGWETDLLEVDDLTLYGEVNVFVEVRCEQKYEPGCYPIILYRTVGEQNLNHLILSTFKIGQYELSLDFETTPGVVYLCVGDPVLPVIQRQIIIPEPPAGVFVTPQPGSHYVPWGHSFTFSVTYDGPQYLIQTSRLADNGDQEVLPGVRTANNEFEYTIPFVKTQPLYVYIGPTVHVFNEWIDKNVAVWSFGSTLHINVDQQDIASIYSITGMLVKRIEVPVGGLTVPMQKGVFIVTLKDGSVHKVIIR